jgi:hypothetical protein
MAWKYGDRTLKVGKAWVDDENFKHPYRWVQWSSADKEKWGVTWEDDVGQDPFDSFYYWGWNSDGDALLPKPLADLKASKVSQAKTSSASLLSQTDWYVTRKAETNTAVPSGITAYRTAVRANYTGASRTAKEIDATSSSVVSTSDNTITSNGHGFVNNEQVYYYVGRNSDDEDATVIGGLVKNTTYFVIATATNTFKLSESHSNCGDEAVVSLTELSSDGTAQTFTSQGKPSAGQTFPNQDMPKYGA